MLSICLPVYNQNVLSLVNKLKEQVLCLNAECEILVFDDASDEKYKTLNRPLETYDEVDYIKLPKNIGRSKIRNLLAQKAKFPYLLFLDCDVIIPDDFFLQRYINQLTAKPLVVCGGRLYPSEKPKAKKRLRWNYGKKYESQPVQVRKKNPNKSFMTNNFLIKRDILLANPFNETLTQYGHEDTLLGFELKNQGVFIQHIENPVINGDIENNCEFINKTEMGLLNLLKVVSLVDYNKNFIADIRLLKVYYRFKSKNLSVFFTIGFYLISKPLKYALIHFWYNAKAFNLYKLLFLSRWAR